MIDKKLIRTLIREEMSRSEVRGIIDSELDSFLKEKEFSKKVRGIVADVIGEFFREMWRKDGFWKNALKNG